LFGWLVRGAAVPGFLSEIAELALGEQVDLDIVAGPRLAAARTFGIDYSQRRKQRASGI